ncbi:Signal recognition particle protein, partial [Haemophilus influenzae]
WQNSCVNAIKRKF